MIYLLCIMEKTIQIPSSVSELTIEQFCEMYQLINNDVYRYKDGSVKESFWSKYIHIVTGISEQDIDNMEWNSYLQLKNEISALKFDLPTNFEDPSPNKEDVIIEFNGKKYKFQPDYGYTKLSTARVIEDMLGDKDFLEHLYLVVAIAFRELDSNGNEIPLIEENLPKKAEELMKMKIGQLYNTLFFCPSRGTNCSLFTNRFGNLAPHTQDLAKAKMQQGALDSLRSLK